MSLRIASRAVATAAALSLVVAGVAAADSVVGDADAVTPGSQSLIRLGTVPAGAERTVDIGFVLACTGTSHAAVGSTITLAPTATAPLDGTIAATAGSLGPVPADWPAAGAACVDDPVVAAGTPSRVTLTAPTIGGTNYVYRVSYTRSPSTGTSGTTAVQIVLDVDANTPPVLDLPGDRTVEADATGGWIADFSATASDAEDAVPPAVTCSPAVGDLVPLGTTTVECAASDAAGLQATGFFLVTVVDTAAPVIGDLPAPFVTTTDPAGAAVTWAIPGATDVADPAPAVHCLPASGSLFAVGTTTVTCTAADASGNASSASFAVSVTLETPPPPSSDLTGTWGRPLADAFPALVGTPGRTVPLKLTVFDGDAVQGPAANATPVLIVERLAACAPDAAVVAAGQAGRFAWADGAWQRNLDTSAWGSGCLRITASDGDDVIATAVIQLGADPAATPTKGRKR